MTRETAPMQGPAPCHPSQSRPECGSCSRFHTGLPADPERRPRTVLLDVTTLNFERCPMREPA